MNGDILPFLQDSPDLSPATSQKLLSILDNSHKSIRQQVELAALIDTGEPFVKATYKLEWDGPQIFECYEVLAALDVGWNNHSTLS